MFQRAGRRIAMAQHDYASPIAVQQRQVGMNTARIPVLDVGDFLAACRMRARLWPRRSPVHATLLYAGHRRKRKLTNLDHRGKQAHHAASS
jgi:hypothetical protein